MAAFLACTGCQHSIKTPPAPSTPIDVSWSAYVGTAIGSPSTRPANPTQGWRADTTLLALRDDPGQVLDPLSAKVQLVLQPSRGEPLLAKPELTQGIRIGTNTAARQWFNALHDPAGQRNAGVGKSSGVLAEGITLAVRAGQNDRAVELRLHRRTDDRLELLIAVQNVNEAALSASSSAEREVVLVEAMPLDTANPVVLMIPASFPDSDVRAIAARFDLSSASTDAAFVDASERTRAWLDASSAGVLADPTLLPTKNNAWSGYELILRSSSDPDRRRAAMNFVAAQTGATLAHDLIVAEDDATLEALNKTVLESMSSLQRQDILLGWLMDYAAIKLCSERAAAGPLSNAMMSVLMIHLGEAGRNASALADLIKGVATRQELQTRILVENMIYLEDSSPAARVRAFDYLAARGKAPMGYDPLGPLPQRRAALERALISTTMPSAVKVSQ